MTHGSAASPSRAGRAFAAGLVIGVTVLAAPPAFAQTGAPGTTAMRSAPAPDTVSPQMQKIIGAPPPTWNVIPDTADGWRAQVQAGAAAVVATLPALREQLHVKVEPQIIDGVKTFTDAR
jgi:epsilon-lactone hydrolase